jgi:putative ABC transport system substrate-binding protein
VIDRRVFLSTVGAGIVAAPLVGEAQQAGKVWRIGNLTGVPAFRSALEARLSDLGYISGRNIALVHEDAPLQPAGAEEVLKTFVPKIDLLVVWGTVYAVAAKRVTTTVPTVFLTVGNPVGIGLVNSLAKPGGNMTGVTFEAAAETNAKRLQLLQEVQPRLTRVAILRAVGDANVAPSMVSLEQAAPKLGITLLPVDMTSAENLEAAFAAMDRSRAQAVVVIAGAFTYLHSRRLAELTLSHRLPSVHGFKEAVVDGGLLSLGPDIIAMAKQAATYVDRIIRGAKPADLPVEQPIRYEVYVNLKTAKALGLTIPQSLLLRADHVIQ